MSIHKFQMAQKALNRFEKLYGTEVLKVYSAANGYISRELTDGMVAGVTQRVVLDQKNLWVVPIILIKKAGGYGELGVILIEDQTLSILRSTDRSKIFQKAEMLVDEKAKAA